MIFAVEADALPPHCQVALKAPFDYEPSGGTKFSCADADADADADAGVDGDGTSARVNAETTRLAAASPYSYSFGYYLAYLAYQSPNSPILCAHRLLCGPEWKPRSVWGAAKSPHIGKSPVFSSVWFNSVQYTIYILLGGE